MTEYMICPFSKPEHADNLVESILRQGKHGLKVVVVENGPGTGAFPAVEGVTVIQSDAHQSSAKNAGLSWVRAMGGGRWSVFDCDDYYGPGYLADQMEALDAGADVAGKSYGSLMYVMFDDGLYLDGMKRTPDFGRFFNGGAVSCSTSDVPDFPTVEVGEDGEWHKAMTKRGARSMNTGARHYCYSRVGKGHTWDPDERSMEAQKGRMLSMGRLPWSTCDLPPKSVVKSEEQSVAKVVMLHTEDYLPAKVAVPDMKNYCKLWGYDITVHSNVARPGWPAAWDKLPAVIDAMSSVPEGEWVLWMDCDMIMTKTELPLETMTRPSKDFMVSVDRNGICTGYFFIRNVPIMRELMDELTRNMRAEWPWEQDVVKEIFASRPDMAARVGHIPETLVRNPTSRHSDHAMVMHFWANYQKDRKALVDLMNEEIAVRDDLRSPRRRPWMQRR